MAANATLFLQCMSSCIALPPAPRSQPGQVNAPFVSSSPELCTSAACVKAANTFLEALDFNVNPCEDFYQFACGKFLENNFIPDDKTSVSQFTGMGKTLENQLRGMFEQPAKPNDILPKQFVPLLYKKCMDRDAINAEGSKALWKMLNGLPLRWPLINANAQAVDLNAIMNLVELLYERYGTHTLIAGGVSIDAKNPTQHIYELHEFGISFEREYYLNDTLYGKYQEAYKNHIRNVSRLLANDAGLALPWNFEQQVQNIYNFEKRIAQIYPTPEDQRNITAQYNKMTLRELQNRIPWINWERLLKKQFPQSINYLVNPNMELIVSSPKFYADLGDIVRTTDSGTLLNVVLWAFASSYLPNDDRFEDLAETYSRILSGRSEKPPRWKECLGRPSVIDEAVSAMYIAKHFNQNSRAEILKIVTNLRNAFQEMLNENNWMDASTKENALLKVDPRLVSPFYRPLSTFRQLLAYDDWIMDDKWLSERYSGLYFNESYSNSDIDLAITRFHIDYTFKLLLKPVNATEFTMYSPMINAFYNPLQNTITFPAGILQPPFFDAGYPLAMSYGAIGSVIGHELTHGFDDNGRLFNHKGELKDWWTDGSSAAFDVRGDCVVDQYNGYRVAQANNMTVNGRLTLGENIADLGGVKMAWRAYKKSVSQQYQPEQRLPGLQQFSNEQLFFMNYAMTWCGKRKTESVIADLLSDPHSPYEARVLGPLSNTPEFATAFNCRAGSKYNSVGERRCTVW